MQTQRRDAASAAAALARSLHDGALEVHYQPVVLLPGRQVIGFEALARLRADDGSLVQPCEFIPLAEAHGLIGGLGHRVLDAAVAEAARWRAEGGALATATVSVNVAPAQLDDPAVVEQVLAVLEAHELPASALVLEVTESAVASPRARAAMEELAGHGIRFAIDDFGTGFATLDSLRTIPAHMLKLDRSFVAGVTRTGADRAIVRAVIDLADSLGMSVVAEGIETEEQAEAVLRLGGAAMQGYLFAAAGPCPEGVAAQATATGRIPVRAEPLHLPGWPLALDEAVLSAARLLDPGAGAHRGAVHALAVALARAAGLDPRTVLAVGRMALVHDLGRLAVDGRLPAALHDVRLEALVAAAGPGLHGSDAGAHQACPAARPRDPALDGSGLCEVDLVRAAVAIADAAVAEGLALDASGLGAAAELTARSVRRPAVRDLLVAVAARPPEVVDFVDLVEDLERRRMGRRGTEERLHSAFGLTRVLGSHQDGRELMRVALEEARRVVGAASASVERWDRDTNQLRCLVNVGYLASGEETFPVEETYALADFAQARRTMLTGLPYIHSIDDVTADADAVELLAELGKYSSAAVPVYVDGRVWGQLWFSTDHGEAPFEARDIETLMGVASLMGGVVVRTELLEAGDRMTRRDALTGVGNRRAVDDELERLRDAGQDAVVALVDLEDLRRVNNLRGYAGGDAVVRQVADALSVATMDCPRATTGRLGGGRFCVMLPGVGLAEARELLAGAVEALQDEGGPTLTLGLVDTAQTPGWTPRLVLVAADAETGSVRSASASVLPRPATG